MVAAGTAPTAFVLQRQVGWPEPGRGHSEDGEACRTMPPPRTLLLFLRAGTKLRSRHTETSRIVCDLRYDLIVRSTIPRYDQRCCQLQLFAGTLLPEPVSDGATSYAGADAGSS